MNTTININLSQYKPQEDWYTMQETAKLLNIKKIGRTKLFNFLRQERILMRNNEPYQKYIDNGCFKLVLKDIYNGYGGVIGCPSVTLVSQKGISLIKKRFEEKEVGIGEA